MQSYYVHSTQQNVAIFPELFDMKTFRVRAAALVAALAIGPILALGITPTTAGSSNVNPVYLKQGKNWGPAQRQEFYDVDQGALIIPYEWAVALNDENGQPFLRDSMSRYGYLPRTTRTSNPNSLPVGFLIAKSTLEAPQFKQLSITCAACHTRQITRQGTSYRVDGGPAFSDGFGFFKGLDAAVDYTLSSQGEFSQFQARVTAQGKGAPTREALEKWYLPYHTLMTNSLSLVEPWGIGRMDALSMIQNRVAGLDLGTPHDAYLLPDNIAPANAPVRYPFLWNAWRQDYTQWAGTSVNGNDSYALERNSGEVLGVFGLLEPKPDNTKPNDYDMLSRNSTNFRGLLRAEWLIKQIGPPKWPFAIDTTKAALGKSIYDQSCDSCHGIKKGAARGSVKNTWQTTAYDVGSDRKYYELINRTKPSSGILEGFVNPVNPSAPPVPATGAAALTLVSTLNQSMLTQRFPEIQLSLRAPARSTGEYEARVLQGVWAAAPFLHNGSVQSLAELLKPAAQRVTSFAVGPEYDTVNVGLAPVQPVGSSTYVTTGCGDVSSGNSNCGHEYGTDLTTQQKDALLEYLKTL